ncbi:hypothetical protein PENTCL1PPCAC_23347, partial [Pristionchus entomophagus]
IGGSSVTLIAMILPGIFSLSLVAGSRNRDLKQLSGDAFRSDEDNDLPSLQEVFKLNNPWMILLNFVIIAFGIIGGVASTISAVNELIST